MPAQVETQNPAGRKPKVKRRKTPAQNTTSTVAAIEGAQGARRSHKTATQPLSPEIVAAATGTSVKEARKARRRGERALKRAAKATEPKARASALTEAQRALRDLSPDTEKDYTKFVDKQGRVRDFEEFAPTGIKIVRALTGDKPGQTGLPAPSEILSVASTLAAGGAGAALKARAATKTAQAVKAAEDAAQASRGARAAQKARIAASSASRTKKAARGAKVRLASRLDKTERKVRRAKRVEGAAHRAVNPIAPAVAQSDPGRALIEGTVSADPKKTLATTARAIPATLAFGATALADIGRAVATGDTGPLEGTAKEFEKATVGVGTRLLSGDPKKVEKTIEKQVGYLGVPLLPRVLGSRPVARAGERIAETARRLDKPTGRIEAPSAARRVRQFAGGKGQRKRVSVLAAREMESAKAHAARASKEIDKPLRKVRQDAEDVVATLARYGISRDRPLEQLRQVERSLDPKDPPAGTVTVRQVRRYAEEHPEVLKSDAVWKAVDAYRGRVTETSPTAKYRAQGDVLGIRPPEDRITAVAREILENRRPNRDAVVVTSREQLHQLPKDAYVWVFHGTRNADVARRGISGEAVKKPFGLSAGDAGTYVSFDPHVAAGYSRGGGEVFALRVRAGDVKGSAEAAAVFEAGNPRWAEGKVFESVPAQNVIRLSSEETKVLADASRGRLPDSPASPQVPREVLVREVLQRAGRRESGQNAPSRGLSRGEAFLELKRRKKVLRASKKGAKTGRPQDVLRYLDDADEVERLNAELDPLSRPGQSLEGKRTRWTKPMVDEYVAEVQAAAKDAGFAEPLWTAERGPSNVKPEAVGSRAAPGARAQHVKTGESARTDIADRSLRALVADSVWRPRMQQALHRFIRRTIEEFAVPAEINGRKVHEVTSAEFNRLVADKKVDSREVVWVPSREYKQAVLDEDFDLVTDLSNFNQHLKGEVQKNSARPGDKGVMLPREVALELSDQLSPQRAAPFSTAATIGSRLVLFSPAWMTAQVVAEGLQAAAAVGPIAWARAAKTLHELKRKDPEGYEAFSANAGYSPAVLEQPGTMRVHMEGDTQRQFSAIGRAVRRTPVGRALYSTATLRVFGLFDRWKSGKYRTVIAAAKADREFNGFVSGVQGMLREQDAIARKLKAMSKSEQLSYIARHPRMFDKHLDYLDDVAGNWQAFSRYERQFAPMVMFYPFLRMSLRWTFWSYPKNHPVRAQLLYLLAQQNANEIDKLLGPGNAQFIDYAMPVVHGKGGKVDAVLPGGQRFATPGLNTLVQSIGEDNIAGLGRVLNPVLSIPLYVTTGVDPMSGVQDPNVNRALLAAQQLLSLFPPVRYAGLNTAGEEQSPASKKFESFDPLRDERSFALPFLPQSAKNARREARLSGALDRSAEGVKSEVGQFIDMAERMGLKGATKQIEKAESAKDAIGKILGEAETPAEKRKVKRIIDAYYAIKYPPQSSASGFGSDWGAGGWAGGGWK